MYSLGSIIIFALYLVFVTTAQNRNKDAIGFPEVEENPLLVNKQNRIPVFLPSMCPENELYYPGDQKDDWICDCRPGYLYHPDTDVCWPAYQKGPCGINEYLILPTNSVIPECRKNPCLWDMMVPWQGTCQKLGSALPCGRNQFPAEALWVNATTLSIECLQIDNDQRLIYSARDIHCCPGCKRYVQNKCTPKKA